MTTRLLSRLLASATLALTMLGGAWAQIIFSDQCADAVLIQPNFVLEGPDLTTSLDTDGGSTCGGVRDVWYRYVPATSGPVSIEMLGFFYDLSSERMPTVLSVHTACPGSVENEIACGIGISGEEHVSQVMFEATAGQTYLIRCARVADPIDPIEVTHFTLEVHGPDLPAPSARLSAPPLFNYQAILREGASGDGLPDGTYTVTFEIFDAPNGGSSVWGPQTLNGVVIADGRINALLGPVDDADVRLEEAFFEPGLSLARFMEITVDGNGVVNETIMPRQQLGTTPYALQAPRSAGLATFGAQQTLMEQGDPAEPPFKPLVGAEVSLEIHARPVLLGLTSERLTTGDNTFGNRIRFVRVEADQEVVVQTWFLSSDQRKTFPVSLWTVDVDPPLDTLGYRVDWKWERIFLFAREGEGEIEPNIAVMPLPARINAGTFFVSEL